MIQKIDVPVSVELCHDHKLRRTYPRLVVWEGKDYPIEKIGYHHTFFEGRVLHHVFSVSAKAMFFRLDLNSENLTWRVKEIADGLPD